MNFEDYNYEQYNQYILVDPNKEPESSRMSQNYSQNGSDDYTLNFKPKLLGFAAPVNSKKGGDFDDKKFVLSEK